MNLQDRNLSIEMRGDDVKLLHSELGLLGFTIPDKELQEMALGSGTREVIIQFQKAHDLEPTGVVNERTAKRINAEVAARQPEPAAFLVQGQARHADGTSLPGLTVRAYDKNLRAEDFLLGEKDTNMEGHYEIPYTANQFRQFEKPRADLFVTVFNADGSPLETSAIRFSAEAVETIDFVIDGEEYRGVSEYERLMIELSPLLRDVQKTDLTKEDILAELTEEDIRFLAGRTGIDPQQIEWLVKSTGLARETELPAEVFYGWFRQDLPTDLSALLDQSSDRLYRALDSALRNNIIPASLRDQVEEILNKLPSLKAEQLLHPPEGQGKASFGDLLSTVLPTEGKRRLVAELYVRHEGTREDFRTVVSEHPSFSPEDAAQIKVTLDLGALTQNNIPLIRELQQMRGPDGPASLRYLAKLNEEDWIELANSHGLPPDVDVKTPEAYADMMTRAIEASFPTAVIAHRIEQDRFQVDDDVKPDLLAFFSQNPEFEFGNQYVSAYLAEKGIKDKPVLEKQLLNMERVFKLTPRSSEMSLLLVEGFHSAQGITRLGRSAFVKKYSSIDKNGGEARGEVIYANAEQNAAMALALFTKYSQAVNSIDLHVTPKHATVAMGVQPITAIAASSSSASSSSGAIATSAQPMTATAGIADWDRLFGSLDLCECEHCRSVYSPAAYLVDILKFLEDRDSTEDETDPVKKTKRPKRSVKSILFQCRPDIGEIELTCENTNTPVPYVDLVNEILENAVSPRPQGTPYPQTRGTAEELSANPEHVNTEAYNKLRNAQYPWNMPLNLWMEEARVYLEHLGVHRYELMETFHKLGSAAKLTEIEIATEYLGLTDKERQIITDLVPQSPWQLWGLKEDDWIQKLSEVPIFLQKSQLSYRELLGLVSMRFAIPAFAFTVADWDGDGKPDLVIIQQRNTASNRTEVHILSGESKFREVIFEGETALPATDDDFAFIMADWDGDGGTPDLIAIKKHNTASNRTEVHILSGKAKFKELIFEGETVLPETDDDLAFTMADWDGGGKPDLIAIKQHNTASGPTEVYVLSGESEFKELTFEVELVLPATGDNLGFGMADWNGDGTPDLVIIQQRNTASNRTGVHILSGESKFREVIFEGEPALPETEDDFAFTMADWDREGKPDLIAIKQRSTASSPTEVYILSGESKFRELIFRGEISLDAIALNIGLCANCDLDQATITNLHPAALRKVHGFIRLWRKLGWSMWDLDKTITALHPADLNNQFLIQLSHIQRLRAVLNVPLVNMLSWWANIDTAIYTDYLAEGQTTVKSLYEQLFQNKAAVTLEPGVKDPFNLKATRDRLETSGLISLHTPALLAPLGISAADLSLLTAELKDVNGNRDDTLSLENLSNLYRMISIARALKLSVRELLSVKALTGIDPFTGTEATLRFVEKVGVIRTSGFSINELDYLLRHQSTDLAPSEESIALVLGEIRDGLQKILAETAILPDPTGDLTRKKLALLGWDNTLIEQVIATLSGSTVYEEVLDPSPQNPDFPGDVPNELKSKVSYDADAKKLRFVGPMTLNEKISLLNLSSDQVYQFAVNGLFDAPRAFVSEKMAFVFPAFTAPLNALPTGVVFPNKLQGKIYYDMATKELRFVGVMAGSEKTTLLNLSSDQAYQGAINTLFNAPSVYVYGPDPKFLDAADASKLFDSSTTADQKPIDAAYRFHYALAKLLPYLRNTLSESLVKERLGETLKLEAMTIEKLLVEWLNSPADPTLKAMDEFLAPAFVETNLTVKLTADSFPDQFKTFAWLHKFATMITRLKITHEQMEWIFEYPASAGWLNLNSLPIEKADSGAALFTPWERLVDLFRLRDTLPLGEKVLSEMFEMAQNFEATTPEAAETEAAWLMNLSELLSWNLDDLTFLVSPNGLNLGSPAAYKDEQALVRLQGCFKMIKRLGASAKQLTDWSKADPTADDAHGIKNAVKAKYDDPQWLAVAKTLRDALREKQRTGLVSYLMAERGVRDANDLYDDFLVDVEMGSCAMTTRIKQAISSVQLFVQRCLMNLEPLVSPSAIDMDQWKWMKNYRVWEANRKVFLYAENWIEPELRDDKSPFFKDLENELLQNDVTLDTAETAFLHYLEKLDEVARLEIVGMYQQKDDGVDILHVFGRTFAIPHIYYYRKLEQSFWSTWEKVDLDIEGDHLVPVVWNRRLYLFWSTFTEKTPPSEDDKKSGADPVANWEIQLAWSEFKNGKWSPKRVSSEMLHHRKLDKKSKGETFTFRVGVDIGDMRIDCFGAKEVEPVDPPSTPQQKYFGDKDFEFPNPTTMTVIEGNVHDSKKRGIPNATVKLFSSGFTYIDRENTLNIVIEIDQSLNTDKEGYYWFNVNTGRSMPRDFDVTIELDWDKYEGSPKSKTISADSNHYYNRDFEFKRKKEPEVETPGPEKSSSRPVDMVSIGRWIFGSNGTTRLEAEVGAEPPNLLEGTHIDGMQFVEDSGEHPLIVPAERVGQPILEPILDSTPGVFRLLAPDHDIQFTTQSPFFYQDHQRTYFVSILLEYKPIAVHFHPGVCDFIKALNHEGIPGLLTLQNQQLTDTGHVFWARYGPAPMYFGGLGPVEDVDFDNDGAYSLYNWELFFHAPLFIADRLSKNQRFEDAQKWFHYIFNPTDSSDDPEPGRFWNTYEFRKAGQGTPIQELMVWLADKKNTSEQKMQLKMLVERWRRNPFKPHLIARWRPTTYQKAVVMKYIDNLIAWGDQLFRRDTIESNNEATQLYILAAQILGKRPESILPSVTPKVMTYSQLEPELDAFANVLIQVENLVPPSTTNSLPSPKGTESLPTLPTLYFCIPKNDKLLGYWDTVADRLFKMRHCMNIEGVVRRLPLFEPPIDPALLVKAAAAGVDISSALSDINAALPHYRFAVMLQKATELCNDVKALGAALLSALEKKDAEELALLRSSHEVELLKAIREIKEQQIMEANNTLMGLTKYQGVVIARQQYYLSRPFMNLFEIGHMNLTANSLIPMTAQAGAEVAAAVLHLIPNTKGGSASTAGATFGGENIASAIQAFGSASGTIASMLNTAGSLSATLGGYQRRQEDWTHQADLATKELEQVKRQIAAAEIRVAIAEHELKNHDLQVENAKEVDAFMRDKYTNQELYNWMVSQISSVYFQSYQLAYDVAKRAERAYRFELGLTDSNFIQFGYWDSLKKGLLAGEKLHYDLKRMDVAYLDQNRREYEITKHISLAMLDPVALVMLKETGQCFVNLPEALFDLDCPGHYMRRIKSVSLSAPCVAGPYAGVNCTLTLLNNSVRKVSTLLNNEYRRQQNNDSRFVDNVGAIQSFVTSSGQNDSGMFEPNLRDERYLWCEGAGVISEWRLELPKEFRQFDYDTISDVILHLRYTAREGGDLLKRQAIEELNTDISELALAGNRKGLFRLFSARHEFPSQWHQFLHPADTAVSQTLNLDLKQEKFPFQFQEQFPDTEIQISSVELFLLIKDSTIYAGDHSSYAAATPLKVSPTPPVDPDDPTKTYDLERNPVFGGLPHTVINYESSPITLDPSNVEVWKLEVSEEDIKNIAAGLQQTIRVNGEDHVHLKPDAIEDIVIVCHYSVSRSM